MHSDVLGSGKVARSELRWSPTCRNATEVCTQATHGTKHEKKGTTAIAQKNPHQHIAYRISCKFSDIPLHEEGFVDGRMLVVA